MDGIHDLGRSGGVRPGRGRAGRAGVPRGLGAACRSGSNLATLDRRCGLGRRVAARHRADGPGALPLVVVLRALAHRRVDADRRGRARVAPRSSSAAPVGASRCRARIAATLPVVAASRTAPTPRFAVGDAVRVREWHPPGHTRAPRYVQGKRGVIVRCRRRAQRARLRGPRRRHACSTRRTRCASRRVSCGARVAPTARSCTSISGSATSRSTDA